jgi:hypothetical protein
MLIGPQKDISGEITCNNLRIVFSACEISVTDRVKLEEKFHFWFHIPIYFKHALILLITNFYKLDAYLSELGTSATSSGILLFAT